MASTLAIAAAEQAGIPFRVHEYEHDPGAASYGLEAADELGVDRSRVMKTLVVEIELAPADLLLLTGGEARPIASRR